MLAATSHCSSPVNAWTVTLILAIALDLTASHARAGQKSQR